MQDLNGQLHIAGSACLTTQREFTEAYNSTALLLCPDLKVTARPRPPQILRSTAPRSSNDAYPYLANTASLNSHDPTQCTNSVHSAIGKQHADTLFLHPRIPIMGHTISLWHTLMHMSCLDHPTIVNVWQWHSHKWGSTGLHYTVSAQLLHSRPALECNQGHWHSNIPLQSHSSNMNKHTHIHTAMHTSTPRSPGTCLVH